MNFDAELSRLFYLQQNFERAASRLNKKAWKIYSALLQEKRRLRKKSVKISNKRK